MPKSPSNQSMVVGLAWFDKAQWQRLTEVVDDRSELDDTFARWERSALDAVRMLERKSQRVEKVYVDVDVFVSWCKGKGLPLNGASRAEYVSFLLQQRSGQGHPVISTEVEVLLHRCFLSAREARHKFITVEHLVLAMLAEPQVSDHLTASSINVEKLRVDLESRVAATETVSGTDDDFDTQPTLEFQRAIQNAILHVQSKGEREVLLMHLITAALDQDNSVAPSSLLETARTCSLCRKLLPTESLTTIEDLGALCSKCIAAVLNVGR